MGELRNRLERRGKVWRPEGYPSITGHQLGILLKMWFHSKGRVDCPVAGEPCWWQSARSLTRKEVIRQVDYKLKHPKWPWQRGKPDADYRGTGYALTPMGWHLCKRIVTAFPREAAEAEAEAAAYFRMFKGEAA
jgi:hypothetical protein